MTRPSSVFVAALFASTVVVVPGPSARAGDAAPRGRERATHALTGGAAGKHASWTEALAPVVITCRNSGATRPIALYGEDGATSPEAVRAFSEVATAPQEGEVHDLHPRLVQLAFKAAYHFASPRLFVVSGYRTGTRRGTGYHEAAAALDFSLEGVDARKLASYLRTLPRVGVGIYTHPSTRYVHLDVREQSFHWLDGSPSGKTWRERPLRDPKRDLRDGLYTRDADLPLPQEEP